MKTLLFLILMFLFALSIASVNGKQTDSEGYRLMKLSLGVGR